MQLKLCIKTYINTFCKNFSYDEIKSIIESIKRKRQVESMHVSRKLTHTDVEAVQQLLDYYNSNTDTLLDIYNKYKHRRKSNCMMTGGGLFNSLTDLKNTAKQAAEKAKIAAENAAKQAATEVKNTATQAASEVKNTAKQAAIEVKDATLNAAKEQMNGLKQVIEQELSTLIDKIKDIIKEQMGEILKNMNPDNIKNIIRDEIEGLLKKYVDPNVIADSVIQKLAKA